MKTIALATALALASAVSLSTTAAEATPPMPESMIEVFNIVPGKHEQFLEKLAHVEAISERLGLPKNDLYIHDGGASWDFILIKRKGQDKAKFAELIRILRAEGYPGGPDYFFESRKVFASHEDTSALGPTTATEYLGTRIKKPDTKD